MVYKEREEFFDKNINYVLPVLFDWCSHNKVGKATRAAGLLALSIIQKTETDEHFYIHNDLEEKILKIVFNAAGELKNELKEIFGARSRSCRSGSSRRRKREAGILLP